MIRSLFFSVALALVACDSQTKVSAPAAELGLETRFPVRMGQVLGQLRIAATDLEKARGLMGVTKLNDAEGMAFMYDAETRMSFWMKDTPLDLDIAFVSAEGVILEVKTMRAGDTATTTSTSDKVRFTVEMASGWYARSGVKVGDKVDLVAVRAGLTARGFQAQRYLP